MRDDLEAWIADPVTPCRRETLGRGRWRPRPGECAWLLSARDESAPTESCGSSREKASRCSIPITCRSIRFRRRCTSNRVVADRTPYPAANGLRLPALARDITIEFTALSLTDSQSVQFRYRLDGHDTDWQDAGNRRQAFYTNLGPGKFRFLVKASNNNGVWNEKGAQLLFSIAPAYYQTTLVSSRVRGPARRSRVERLPAPHAARAA